MHIFIKKINKCCFRGFQYMIIVYKPSPYSFLYLLARILLQGGKKNTNAFSSIISWQRKLVFTSLLNNPLTKKKFLLWKELKKQILQEKYNFCIFFKNFKQVKMQTFTIRLHILYVFLTRTQRQKMKIL